jgi:hypothetical protein
MAPGWATRLLGMWPICNIQLEGSTGYYHRFHRKGLVNFLPTSASPSEKSLAVCADHVVLEWEQNSFLKFLNLPEPWVNITSVLDEVKTTLSKLIQRRCTMTKAEASWHNFKGKIITTISDFLARVPSYAMLWQACGDKSSHFMFMLKVEYNLNPILARTRSLPVFHRPTAPSKFSAPGPLLGRMHQQQHGRNGILLDEYSLT